ncbi:uncharacterized protein Gm53243 [Mus musculus]|uniref:uncharacterized protein Gm53243 n=1 Tax=Mus musculus TaxID=10090 RepID=UPI0011AE8B8F|nr:uncharacterized protein Gm53243 [Mus musculus]
MDTLTSLLGWAQGASARPQSPYLLPRRPSLVRGPSRARIARSSSARPALRQAGRHEPVEAPLPPSCTLSPRARHCPATLADPRTDLLGVRCRAAPARAPLLRFPLLAPGRCALTGPGPLLPLPLPAAPSLLPPLPAEPRRAQAEPSSGAELGVGRGRAGPGARNPALRLWSGGAPTGRVARAPQGAWVSEWRGCGPPGHWSGTPWCLSPEQFRAGCLCPTPRPWCGRRPQPMIYPRVECYNPIVRLHWASEEGCTRRKPCTDPDAPYGEIHNAPSPSPAV